MYGDPNGTLESHGPEDNGGIRWLPEHSVKHASCPRPLDRSLNIALSRTVLVVSANNAKFVCLVLDLAIAHQFGREEYAVVQVVGLDLKAFL